MFTITAIESIRITHTVYRIWVQRLLTDIHPNRAQELAALSDRDLAAELAASASGRRSRRPSRRSLPKHPSSPEPAISPSESAARSSCCTSDPPERKR